MKEFWLVGSSKSEKWVERVMVVRDQVKLHIASADHTNGFKITRDGVVQDLVLGLTGDQITFGSTGAARSAFAVQTDGWSAGDGDSGGR